MEYEVVVRRIGAALMVGSGTCFLFIKVAGIAQAPEAIKLVLDFIRDYPHHLKYVAEVGFGLFSIAVTCVIAAAAGKLFIAHWKDLVALLESCWDALAALAHTFDLSSDDPVEDWVDCISGDDPATPSAMEPETADLLNDLDQVNKLMNSTTEEETKLL